MKKKKKILSSYSILFIIILVVGICTWFIPAGQYDVDQNGNYVMGSYKTVDSAPQGLWEMFMAPINGMLGKGSTPGAIEVALYVLIIGGFLGVVTKTRAIDNGIISLMTKRQGQEHKLIPILFIIFALGGTTYGMGEETIAFYPILMPIMLMAGFDTLASASIILLGAGIGCLGSTINPFATGIASASIGISPGEGIGGRIVLLLVNIVIGFLFVYRYALKVRKDPSKSYVYDTMEEDKAYFSSSKVSTVEEFTKRQQYIIWIFVITFIIMIMSLIPWNSLNKSWTFFDSFVKWLVNVPVLGMVLGKDMVPFGSWYFRELGMLFLISAIIIGFVYRVEENEFIDSFLAGSKDLLGVALIVGLARGIQVIMNDGHITATILHWGETGLNGLPKMMFGILVYIFYFPLSFLIPSTSGLAAATMGIMGPMAKFSHLPPHIVVTAYQSACGIVNMVAPTSGILVGALSISRISLGSWLKYVTPLILVLIVVNLLIIAGLCIL